MKVLLMQDVAKVGKKYEVKEVASGFARNFLIPSGKAVNPETFSGEKLKALQDKHLHAADNRLAELKAAFAGIAEPKVTIDAKANDEGHLFAGIGKEAIVEAIKDQLKITVDQTEVHLGHPLKSTGSHEVEIGTGNKIEVIIEG
ncbi:MAG: large subunit ribosomal protein [Patescibacteria group bacterium]|nr:large subunit ribosomal protein [Patescibacteria group bacterium]